MSPKLLFVALLVTGLTFAQDVRKIETWDGIRYITSNCEYPITGTYHYRGAEPIVELNSGGNGYYQLHEQVKRPVIWGIECDESGVPSFTKGFDNGKYTLWYQYTTRTELDDDDDMGWKPVGLTVHFNSKKIFIQGERSKTYGGEAER
jgi:hypothetical protein